MKPIITLIFVILLAGCNQEEGLEPRKKEAYNELPSAIIPTKPCTTLYKSIMDMFYEHQNNKEKHAELFGNVQKQIVLTQESELYVSFIAEGAGFDNTLGWYAYDAVDGPGENSKLELNVLFPHVSKTILTKGDMVQVGTG